MAKFEKLENHSVKFTFEIDPAQFAQALTEAYRKTGKRYSVPGFRKGKLAPKKMIESHYGEGVFFETAFEEIYNKVFPEAIKEHDIKMYNSQPEISVEKIGADDGLVFDVVVDLALEMTLGDYKGIELKKTDYTVHKKDVDAEVEKRIMSVRDEHASLISVERPVEMGDTVEIDYSGSVDGVKFEGGTAQNQTLEIGSGHFIPGFEEQVVGMKVGEEKDINVTFPEQYHSEELAGKEAVFAIKLHSVRVKELPNLDDDFVADISEFSTVEEYTKSIRKEVEKAMKADHEAKKTNDAITKAIEASTFLIPPTMIREQAEELAMESLSRMGVRDMDFATFCQMVGAEPAQMLESYKEHAAMRIKSEMLFGKIAEAENIEISDEELEAEAKKLVDTYATEDTTEEAKAQMFDTLLSVQRDIFVYQLRLEKAQKIITDTMVIK